MHGLTNDLYQYLLKLSFPSYYHCSWLKYGVIFLQWLTCWFTHYLLWNMKGKLSSIFKWKQMMKGSQNINLFMSSECEVGINCKAWIYSSVTMSLSLAGFFLFIYYYNTRHTAPTNADTSGNRNSTSSTSTYQTTLDMLTNPYVTYEKKT